MGNTAALQNYTGELANLPDEVFLGSIVFFSIQMADVNLPQARNALASAGLDLTGLRENLRPVDAFKKATAKVKHKFTHENGMRAELMVRDMGQEKEETTRHFILERIVVEKGRKKRASYDKVGQAIFTRGKKDKEGVYVGHGVDVKATAQHMQIPLNKQEAEWLTAAETQVRDDYYHLLEFMDSHAVRTFVREYIYRRNGICVKGSGGLYFVAQEHADEMRRLGEWVRSVGSEFHMIPLLDLADQRQKIMDSFEDDTIAEVQRLMDEVYKILSDPNREIEAKTFDAYGLRCAELKDKVTEYNKLLGGRAKKATVELDMFGRQVLDLAKRIKSSDRKSHLKSA